MTKLHWGTNNMDCLEGLKMLKDESVDLTITSPPYDDLRDYKGYAFDIKKVVKELYRVTKQGGVCVWVINDRVKNGSKTLTSFRHALYFQDAGFNVNDVMIWNKTNPMPQVRQPRYNQVFEYMFVFSKGKPKTFNPIMIPCKTSGLSYKSTAKQITTDKNRVYKEMVINKEKVSPNIWDMAVAQNKTSHPAVFPEELVYKHIISWSNEGDIVMDIFSGSGTTHKVALENNRKFIGFEIAKEYCEIEKERLKSNGLWRYDY